MNDNIADATRPALVQLLTNDDMERLLQVDRRTVSRLCKKGVLPQPLKLGGGNRWISTEVMDAIDNLNGSRGRRTETSCLVAV